MQDSRCRREVQRFVICSWSQDSKKGLLVRWPGMKRRRYMSWNKKTLKRLERAKNPKKGTA